MEQKVIRFQNDNKQMEQLVGIIVIRIYLNISDIFFFLNLYMFNFSLSDSRITAVDVVQVTLTFNVKVIICSTNWMLKGTFHALVIDLRIYLGKLLIHDNGRYHCL